MLDRHLHLSSKKKESQLQEVCVEFSSVKSRSISRIYLKPIHMGEGRDMDVAVRIGVLGSSCGFVRCCHRQQGSGRRL